MVMYRSGTLGRALVLPCSLVAPCARTPEPVPRATSCQTSVSGLEEVLLPPGRPATYASLRRSWAPIPFIVHAPCLVCRVLSSPPPSPPLSGHGSSPVSSEL
ncbi:hypothetical protein F5883DRAFT_543254 [Diaporthe sp. PMI_573]|nr:hypothetical protein F5883DRAFT_543254 [Diaporthaceae sp. PMI_573]